MSSKPSVRVGDVMSTPLETISPAATIAAAAEMMCEREISALVVTTGPAAILTTTDIVEIVSEGVDPTAVSVREAMTTPVETIPPEMPLEDAGSMMTNFGVKHLPVVDDDYVGMISSTDVTAYLSQ